MAKITAVSVLFFVDSLRQMVDSVLGASLPSTFMLEGRNGETSATFASGEGVNMFKNTAFDPDAAGAGVVELEYNKVAGKLQIPSLTTTGLPQNRQYWQSFGQLFEDVYLGRIPELVTAQYLFLDQVTQRLWWAPNTGGDAVSDEGDICFSGNDSKAGADFFEA